MMRMCNSVMAIAAILAMSASPVAAQGVPVIDKTAILRWGTQLEEMGKQLEEAQKLYGSLNKLTDMADVASLLNKPEIRQALPENFSAIESLFSGNGAGAFGDAASQFLESNSTYKSSANDFYAQELARIQNRNAGQMSLGQQIYDTATKRIEGIDQLRQRISSAGDAKEIADLQARIQAESAFLQTDLLRMQGLQMIQQAQVQVEQQRQAEDWKKRMDTIGAAFE